MRPALSGFGDDADAERGLVLVFGAPALLAAGELAVVDCGSSPDDRHGAKPKWSMCMWCTSSMEKVSSYSPQNRVSVMYNWDDVRSRGVGGR